VRTHCSGTVEDFYFEGGSAGSLTQGHDGEVFPTELAGDGDLLPQGPASLGDHMMGGRRRVMAHLRDTHTHTHTQSSILNTYRYRIYGSQ